MKKEKTEYETCVHLFVNSTHFFFLLNRKQHKHIKYNSVWSNLLKYFKSSWLAKKIVDSSVFLQWSKATNRKNEHKNWKSFVYQIIICCIITLLLYGAGAAVCFVAAALAAGVLLVLIERKKERNETKWERIDDMWRFIALLAPLTLYYWYNLLAELCFIFCCCRFVSTSNNEMHSNASQTVCGDNIRNKHFTRADYLLTV